MDLLNAITLTQPTGLWETILFGLESAVKDYALALIIITVICKLVLVPFDFVGRFTQRKSSRKQAEMNPELEKIKQKYGNNKDIINQKTMEVYKNHNFSIKGMCLGMVFQLAMQMVIFWTLFAGLGKISNYKIADQFLQVRQEYFAAYSISVDELGEGETAMSVLNSTLEGKTDDEKAVLLATATTNTQAKYDEVKTSFLWIENIWLSDAAWESPVMDYESFIKSSSITAEDISEEEYNLVMAPVKDVAKPCNGYFILAVLSVATNIMSSTISTWLTKRRAKRKGLDTSTVTKSGKGLTLVLPMVMGLITLFYNSAFGLYLVAGGIVTMITSPLLNMFVDMLEFDAIEKEKNKVMAAYDRKRK